MSAAPPGKRPDCFRNPDMTSIKAPTSSLALGCSRLAALTAAQHTLMVVTPVELQQTVRFCVFGTVGTSSAVQWTTKAKPTSERTTTSTEENQDTSAPSSSDRVPSRPREMAALDAEAVEHSLLDALSTGEDSEVRVLERSRSRWAFGWCLLGTRRLWAAAYEAL